MKNIGEIILGILVAGVIFTSGLYFDTVKTSVEEWRVAKAEQVIARAKAKAEAKSKVQELKATDNVTVAPKQKAWSLLIYTSKGCAPCARLKAYLDSTPFWSENYKITWKDSNSQQSTPTIEVRFNDSVIKTIVGFSNGSEFKKEIELINKTPDAPIGSKPDKPIGATPVTSAILKTP